MKHLFVKWLSVLMMACLVLTSAAFAEALPEAEFIDVGREGSGETPSAPDAKAEEAASEEAADAMSPEIVQAEETGEIAEPEPTEVVVVEEIDIPHQEEDVDLVEEAQDFTDAFVPVSSEVEYIESEDAMGTLMEAGTGLVPITASYFPDVNFRNFISKSYDKNSDGYLSPDEASAMTQLTEPPRDLPASADLDEFDDYDEYTIHDLTGLEYFPELKKISWIDGELHLLDVSGNTKLEYLDCSGNRLSVLNLGINPNLTYVDCSENIIEALDITNNPNLKDLDCYKNSLTVLRIGSNTALTYLICDHNKLSSLDVSNNTNLKGLSCSNNNLTSLNITGCTGLNYMYCENNPLAELDISDFTSLMNILNSSNMHDVEGFRLFCDKYEAEAVEYLPWEESTVLLTYDYRTKIVFQLDKLPITSDLHPLHASAASSGNSVSPSGMVSLSVSTPSIAATKKSNKATITAAPGSTYQLDLGGATGKKYKSSRKKVATVSSTGLVTVKKAGKTRITFKVGKKTRSVMLKVIDPTVPTSISLNMSGINTVKKGDTVTLTATLPEGTNSGIKWKTNKKSVATVKDGVVTFKKKGKVTITAIAARGKKKAVVKFKVGK